MLRPMEARGHRRHSARLENEPQVRALYVVTDIRGLSLNLDVIICTRRNPAFLASHHSD